MEDAPEVCARPYNPAKPAACMDEKPFQSLGDVREPTPMKPGEVEKVGGEYKREGSRGIFTEPLAGRRRAEAFEHRA
jgi:hypothetical protein